MLRRIDADIDALLLIIDGAKNDEECRAQVKGFLFQTYLDAERWREKCCQDAQAERMKRMGCTV